jgi:hypothetical protein
VSLHFKLELYTLWFLNVPEDKNPKDWHQHVFGLYLKNCLRIHTDMNFFPCFGVGHTSWSLSKPAYVCNSLPYYVSKQIVAAATFVLSLSDNLIPSSIGVKMQAGQGGRTEHTDPTFFSPFQKHCLITRRTLLFHLSNGAKWSVRHF